jgi:hypothetical protein
MKALGEELMKKLRLDGRGGVGADRWCGVRSYCLIVSIVLIMQKCLIIN